jgi:hypothetical protein
LGAARHPEAAYALSLSVLANKLTTKPIAAPTGKLFLFDIVPTPFNAPSPMLECLNDFALR